MKLIITADWHLRATAPRCRTDNNWIERQKDVLRQITDYAIKYKAKVCVVGDIFHTNSDTSFEVINMVQKMANELEIYGLGGLYILAGNHDLPYHNSENINKSAIGLLLNSESIHKIEELGDNISAPNFDEEVKDKEIVFRHVLVMPDDKRNPMIECKSPRDLFKETPNSKWIFTGDYHHEFCSVYKEENYVNGKYAEKYRFIVNPGCIIRQVSDMKDYQCGVRLVDTDDDSCIKFLPLQDGEDIIDDSYILKNNEREERIENFANKLIDNEVVSLDFVENVKTAISKNNLSAELINTINKLIGV